VTKVKEIVIVDYEAQWPAAFEAERAKLAAALGENVVAVEHIGSTSIEGLAAKPIIDIMIAVRSLADADAHCIEPIVALGYEYCPQFEAMMPYRRYFRRLVPNSRITRITFIWWRSHSHSGNGICCSAIISAAIPQRVTPTPISKPD